MFENKKDEVLKQKVRTWWNDNMFNYNVTVKEGSWEYYRNIDKKILKWIAWGQTGYPLLSGLIDYDSLKGKKVLDIGCGAGWSTEQFVRTGSEVTAIDLTPKAVEITKRRFELYNLPGTILEADAENLPFPDNHFDFVLAWGVLMHTPDTEKAVDEIWRVLKPGGRAAAMIYNKDSFKWWYFIWFGKGIMRLQLFKYSQQGLADRFTDGAYQEGNMHTKYYTRAGLKKLWSRFSQVKITAHENVGAINKIPHRLLPLSKYILPRSLKKFLISKFGGYAWIDVQK